MTDTPKRPFAVVLNPHAGGGLARRAWPELRAELDRRGLTHTLVQADSAAAALEELDALPPEYAVMTLGGEGTVAGVLPALIGQDRPAGRPLAMIPLGTGNDFAGMTGLRPRAFTEALDRLAFAPRQVDALRVRILTGEQAGREAALLNGLGMGFDSQVTANMTRVPARLSGLARYAWAAVVTVRELRLTEVEITVDGARLYQGPSALAAVMNGQRFGGGFQISPLSDARDGLLNVLTSTQVSRGQLVGLMLRVLRGRHLGHPAVRHAQGEWVHVRWAAPQPLHLDGDLSGTVSELEVVVLPGAVTLLNA